MAVRLKDRIEANIRQSDKINSSLSINGKTFNGSTTVDVGVISAAYGGTGQTTLRNAANALINALGGGTAIPGDQDYYISQYVGGGTTTTTYHRRPHSALYTYIKNKAEGTWGISISGKAATATALTSSAGSTSRPIYFSSGKPAQITLTLPAAAITTGFDTAFRISINGSTSISPFLGVVRTNTASVTYAPQYGSGIVWGREDTHGYLYVSYSKSTAYLGGGNADKLNWIKQIAFTDSNVTSASKLATARTIQINLASTSSASFNGTDNITPGVIGTLPITNGGTGATTRKDAWANLIPCYTSPWSTQAKDTGDNWAALGNQSVTWWPDSANGIYGKPSSWGLVFTISASSTGSQEMHQLWFSQSNGAIYHRGGNGATASSMRANSWARLWQLGDSITGAVWNDYAEYRESDCQEFGRVLVENGDDSLSVSNFRLQPFAGVSSDTWGFCQGETEKAKTPIAVAGRVLVYSYQDRNNYKPGDCVCAAPNGTVDIMTRQEVIQYPDRIVGTVSCVPDYEEWGQGDRPTVKVDGRIWIKVR